MCPSPLKRGSCRKPKKKKKVRKEEIAEDFCFVCKDGGDLRVCDYKNCLKAYHPFCVGKDATFLESGARWICNWHSCFICSRTSKFHCLCCTNSVCKSCIKAALFVHVRCNKGFCNNCLKLSLLIEAGLEVDSDGGPVDFKARDTYEFLFKDYWEIVKEKEGLTLNDLHSADTLLKKGEHCWSGSDSNANIGADMDYTIEIEPCTVVGELREQEILSPRRYNRKVNSKKREFIGWGSRSLIEFLASIGKDTSKPISQYGVQEIIIAYIHEKNLTDPTKKKKVICDAGLQSVFGKKFVNRNKIYDLLEFHFAANLEESEEDDLRYNSDEKEIETAMSCKRPKVASSRKHENKKVIETPQSCFASVTAANIKLIYLRKSLIEYFLRNPETFDKKVIGSFVRIKSDPNDYFQRNAYQLVQVTGTNVAFGTSNVIEGVIVQVSSIDKAIPISRLSDDDFLEEEVEDLHQRVKVGLLKKLAIVELKHKAQSLHKDLTEHWIERELVLLQNLISRANEKGWRRELGEYLEKWQLLKTPSEKQRLLEEIPEVIAEEIEPKVVPQDLPEAEKLQKDDLSGTVLPKNSKDLSANETPPLVEVRLTYATGGDATNVNAASEVRSDLLALDGKGDASNDGGAVSIHVSAASEFRSTVFSGNGNGHAGQAVEEITEEDDDAMDWGAASGVEPTLFAIDRKGDTSDVKAVNMVAEGNGVPISVPYSSFTNSNLPVDEKESPGLELSQCADENDGDPGTVMERVYIDLELSDDDNPESYLWYYLDPNGNEQGPFPMSKLKQWNERQWFTPDFRVWKKGEAQEEAILLKDALCRIFPNEQQLTLTHRG